MTPLKSIVKYSIILALCAVTLACCAQSNQKTITAVDETTISTAVLDANIDSLVKQFDIPALSIAIINDSKMIYHNTIGVTNSETKEPVDEQTIFEAASLSKPVFAYFVLKMVEKGVLDLDKPLYKYLPHPEISEVSKEDYKLITARMVLSHKSGFPNHANGEKIKLAFMPGTDFMYSGAAYEYLARVIGQLNDVGIKAELNALIQKEVTQPLNMPQSTFFWNNYVAKHKAFGHDQNGKPTQNSPGIGRWTAEAVSAGSSLHSEAQEYAQFLVALLKQNGLRDDTFNEMFTEHTHFKDNNPLKQQTGQTGWGLGLAQKPTEYGMMHLHTGNNHDFQAYMMILPEKEFGIVFFINCDKAIPFIQGLNSIVGPIF
jgi:CubicO group peptidase (beta-lactamase class C family)